MAGSSDEYWGESLGIGFSFDEHSEEKGASLASRTGDIINNEQYPFESTIQDSEVSSLQLSSVFPQHFLNKVLDDINVASLKVPNIQEALTNTNSMLGMYKSLSQKLELLDEAVSTDDGNIIMRVLLFLRRSLKPSVLYYYLAARKVALQHYTNYLIKESHLDELSHLYMYTKNYIDIVYLYYLGFNDISNRNRTLQALSKFLSENQHCLDNNIVTVFGEFKKFIQWQIEYNFVSNSVVDQLIILFKNKWGSSSEEKKMSEFRKKFSLSAFQYDWTFLNYLCSEEMWPTLKDTFIKPNWLSKKSSFKSAININLFILTVLAHGAPRALLEEFLIYMDGEEKIFVAKKIEKLI